jgi:hypothetical protein
MQMMQTNNQAKKDIERSGEDALRARRGREGNRWHEHAHERVYEHDEHDSEHASNGRQDGRTAEHSADPTAAKAVKIGDSGDSELAKGGSAVGNS